MDPSYEQLSLFENKPIPDPRPPETVTWNGIHGCRKVSPGCLHCYMFRRDESVGKDPTIVRKTQSFNLPVRRLRAGAYKGFYKIPSGSHIFTCFSSDFFHKDADDWRDEMWSMIRERNDCTFFMITKRPERIAGHLPADWKPSFSHVTIAVTCENQTMADKRLPVYLALPLHHFSVMVEPMLSRVSLKHYFIAYTAVDSITGKTRPLIESVSAGGESGPDARPCVYNWVLDLHTQCVEYGISFSYHQTGARLIKNGREYNIPREYQHEQAHKAGLDYDPESGVSGLISAMHAEIPGE